MPECIQARLFDILRYCKLNLNSIKTSNFQWPREIYKLIDREDAINFNHDERTQESQIE